MLAFLATTASDGNPSSKHLWDTEVESSASHEPSQVMPTVATVLILTLPTHRYTCIYSNHVHKMCMCQNVLTPWLTTENSNKWSVRGITINLYVPGISCQLTAISDTGMEKCSATWSRSTSNALEAIPHKAMPFTKSGYSLHKHYCTTIHTLK